MGIWMVVCILLNLTTQLNPWALQTPLKIGHFVPSLYLFVKIFILQLLMPEQIITDFSGALYTEVHKGLSMCKQSAGIEDIV